MNIRLATLLAVVCAVAVPSSADAAPVTITPQVSAPDTYFCTTANWKTCATARMTMTLDQEVYAPGGTVTVTGRLSLFTTPSGANDLLTYYSPGFTWELNAHKASVAITVFGQTKQLFTGWENFGGGTATPTGGCKTSSCPTAGTVTFTAPTTPGTHTATCNAYLELVNGGLGTAAEHIATIPPANCSITFTVGNPLPDLIAGPINETTAVAGAAKIFSTLITNQGSASTTGPFYNRLQRATSCDITTDTATGAAMVNHKLYNASPLGPFVPSSTVSFNSYTIPTSDANTTRCFRACADLTTSGLQYVAESDEANNCGRWTRVQVTSTQVPDLKATSITAPSAVATTESAALSGQVKNFGSATISNFPSVFLVQAPGGAVLARAPASTISLAPDGSMTLSAAYSTTTPGTYTVRLFPNMSTTGVVPAVSESLWTNNPGPAATVTVSPPPSTGKPNLRVFERVAPQTAVVGVTQSYSVPVYNTSADVSVTEPFDNLLQKTNSIDASGNATTPVYDVNAAATTTDVPVNGQATISVSTLASTWSSADAGTTRHLRICADKDSASSIDGTITESNSEDNCGEWTPIVVEAPKPDLSTGDVYWSPTGSDAVVGQARSYTARVSNASAPTGGIFYNRFYVATEPNGGGTITSATYQMGALSAGSSGLVTRSHEFPSAGDYSLRVCADVTGLISESNEGNNCGANWTTVLACVPNRGVACESAPNECGVPATGTIQCDGSCSAGAPPACTLPPVTTLTADPLRVPKGNTTVVTWSGTNTPSACTLRRFVEGVESTTGGWPITASVLDGTVRRGSTSTPVTTQTVYRVRCDNAVGYDEKSVTVNIFPDFTEF